MPSVFNHDYFECVCSVPEHTLRFTYIKEPIHADDHEIYVEVYLNSWYPWYKRAWVALKYALGLKPKTGHFDCTVLDAGQADKLATLLSPELRSLQATKIALMNALRAESLKAFPRNTDEGT